MKPTPADTTSEDRAPADAATEQPPPADATAQDGTPSDSTATSQATKPASRDATVDETTSGEGSTSEPSPVEPTSGPPAPDEPAGGAAASAASRRATTTGRDRSRSRRRPLRTALLTVHILVSVSWNGVAFAQLILASTAAADGSLRHPAYELMHMIDRTLNIPLALLTLVSGILIAARTRWGLLQHWWVATKLAITAFAVIFAGSVIRALIVRGGHATGGSQVAYGAPTVAVILCGCLMNVLFISATVLSTTKPWGRTPRGRRNLAPAPRGSAASAVIPSPAREAVPAVGVAG